MTNKMKNLFNVKNVKKMAENRGISVDEFYELYRYDVKSKRWIPKARFTRQEMRTLKESKDRDKLIRKNLTSHKRGWY